MPISWTILDPDNDAELLCASSAVYKEMYDAVGLFPLVNLSSYIEIDDDYTLLHRTIHGLYSPTIVANCVFSYSESFGRARIFGIYFNDGVAPAVDMVRVTGVNNIAQRFLDLDSWPYPGSLINGSDVRTLQICLDGANQGYWRFDALDYSFATPVEVPLGVMAESGSEWDHPMTHAYLYVRCWLETGEANCGYDISLDGTLLGSATVTSESPQEFWHAITDPETDIPRETQELTFETDREDAIEFDESYLYIQFDRDFSEA